MINNNAELLTAINEKAVVFVSIKESYEHTVVMYPYAVFDTLDEAEEYVANNEAPYAHSTKAWPIKQKYSEGYTDFYVLHACFKIMHKGVMYDKGTAGEEWLRLNPDFMQVPAKAK